MNNSSTSDNAGGQGNYCKAELWWRLWLPLIIVFFSFLFFRTFQYVVRWYLFGKWTFPTFSYFKIRRRRRRASKKSGSNSGGSSPRRKKMDSKSLEIVPPNKKWRISNEFVSLFHSILSGIWALAILTRFDFHKIDDLVNKDSLDARYLTYMSFGYLVHDFIDLVINERSARIIELLFHHVVVLVALMVTHLSCRFLYIITLGLLMEVNSILLHSRSLCNLYRQPKQSNLFKIIALLNIATFMLFRIVVSLGLIGWLISEFIKWKLDWYLLLVNTLVICSLSTTNFVLFYRVLAADGLLGANRARRQLSREERQHKQQQQQTADGEQPPPQTTKDAQNSDDDDDFSSSASSSGDEGGVKAERDVTDII
ncbi:hypothetical protein niasHS_014347 [Heterodera schachtii]|uniref:TLC domain-containing protein n=1 Tax=Heterodera schachtii TaxID=97005 RepID=A0ABD2I3W4_HETSC